MLWHLFGGFAIRPRDSVSSSSLPSERGKVMRKLIWCGGAALMVCAAGVYWAAGWAERHPQAPMAGCARIPWQLLTDWNPIVQVGKAMGAKTLTLFEAPKPPAPQ